MMGGWITLDVSPACCPGPDKRHVEAEHNNTTGVEHNTTGT